MKKLLIALATTVTLVGPAAAANERPSMPVGDWCLFQGEYPNPMYFRAWVSDDDCGEKLTIKPDGYETYAVSCTFSHIRVHDKDAAYPYYTVSATCLRRHGSIVRYRQKVDLQEMKMKLYFKAYRREILEKAP